MDVSSAAPTTTAPAADPSTPQAPISTDPTPAAPAAPAAFSWDTAGLDPAAIATVQAKGWKGVGETVASYQHLEKAIGVPPERLIKLPAATETDPKVWNDVYTKLGRPESADKYVVPVPDGDKGEFANLMKPIFHKAGLSQSMVTEVATQFNAMQAAQVQAQTLAIETKHTAEVADLKQAWGPDYEMRAGLVDKAAETFGMTQEQLTALKSTMGPKAAMTFLYNLGARLGVEDTSVPGLTAPGHFGMTPEAAQAEISRLKGDRDFAQLFSSKDPKQRMEARHTMDRLQKLAYPGMTPVPGSVARPRTA